MILHAQIIITSLTIEACSRLPDRPLHETGSLQQAYHIFDEVKDAKSAATVLALAWCKSLKICRGI